MLIESCPFLISVAFFRQLILKSKATSPLTLYFLMLRGPFGEMQVQPKIYHFEFTETTCESPLVALPLTDSAECNKVLSGKAINCRWNVVISCRPSSIVFACSELRLRSVSCTLFLYLSFSSNLNGFILRWIFANFNSLRFRLLTAFNPFGESLESFDLVLFFEMSFSSTVDVSTKFVFYRPLRLIMFMCPKWRERKAPQEKEEEKMAEKDPSRDCCFRSGLLFTHTHTRIRIVLCSNLFLFYFLFYILLCILLSRWSRGLGSERMCYK